MPFVKGKSGNAAGRPAGAVNVFTKTVKETVLEVFHALQEDENHNLKAFAKKYPRDYYQIAAKLIPTEIKAEVTIPEGIKVIYGNDEACRPIGTNPESNSGILGEQGGL